MSSPQHQDMIPLPPGDPLASLLSDTPSDMSDGVSDTSDAVRVGSRLSVRIDQQVSDDLLTIMQGSGNVSDAVRYALQIAARACRGAWTLGYTDTHTLPQITAFRVDMLNGRYGDMVVRRPNGGV